MSRAADLLLRLGDTQPIVPTSGQISLYAKTNGTFYSLDSNGTETPLGGGGGSVTSVDVSGGTTGLTTSGGPITGSGTITLGGTLAIANGGTGATTQAGAANAILPSQTGNNGKFLTTDGTNVSWTTVSGTGTVTSVTGSGGTTGLTLSGGPITTSGTLTLGGTLAIASGGSGSTTAQGAMNAFAGAVTSGSYLRGNGTNVVMSAIQAADVPTLNQNTTGSAATLTTTRTISATGDATWSVSFNGSANATAVLTLANSGVTANTYGSATQVPVFTVDAKGRITSVTNTTITAGSGTVTSVNVSGGTTGLTTSGGPVTGSGTITLSGTLAIANGGTGATTQAGAANAILPSQSSNAGKVLTTDGTNVSWTAVTGTGTVTGVSVVNANGFDGTVANSTTTPAITLKTTVTGVIVGDGTGLSAATGTDLNNTFGSQTANRFYAAPNGSAGNPSFRAIVAADIPTLNQNTTGTAANVTGTVLENHGGTGQTSYTTGDILYASASNTLSKLPIGTSGQVLSVSGSGVPQWQTQPGTGTVTSVTVNGTSGRITSTGSPINTSGTITMDLATTAVSAGSYTNANITVDAYGRITSASSGSAGAGGKEIVVFKYTAGGSGNLTGVDAIVSQTSGVTPTITDGANCIVQYAFSGYTNPPKSVMVYGQIYASNDFSMRSPPSTANFKIAGGGTSGTPDIISTFSSSNILTLQSRMSDVGASASVGQRAYLVVVFGF